jgi:YD repeat-containing protein
VASASGVSFQYDANGNMTTRTISGTNYYLAYDGENQLTGVTGGASATFSYDGDGKRVKGTVSGTTTVYIGNYYEWTGSTSTSKKYYYAGTVRIAMRTGPTTLNWLLGDHLGSTNRIANGDGSPSGPPITYKPWGETRTGTSPTTYKFTGQRQDSYITDGSVSVGDISH